MPVQKIDPKVIFASNAPAIDNPPIFSDKTKGWDVSRANDGRPTIKEMNKVQQDTDLKILWLNENSVTPYDASIDYPDGAVTLKDGSFKQLVSGAWVEFLDDFANKDEVKRGIANRYDPLLTYGINNRVVLENGDIVKSTVNGNTNDPNVDMTGWVKTNDASQIFDVSGEDQQKINFKARQTVDGLGDERFTPDINSTVFIPQINSFFEHVGSGGDIFSGSKNFKVKRSSLMTPIEAFGGGIDKTAAENTAAIIKFLNSADHSILLFMKNGTYNHNSINLSGFTNKSFVGGAFGSRQKNTILKNAEFGTSFYGDVTAIAIAFSGLYIQGQVGGTDVTRGVVLLGSECTVRDCWFRYFNDQGLSMQGGIATVENCTGWDCCRNYNATTKRGALEIAGNDGYYINLQFGCAQNVPEWQKITSPSLNNVGVYITNGNNMIVNVSGENCDVSIEMVGNGFNRLVNCRADQCWGTGWIIGSNSNMISNGLCENVSLTATNAYDAFLVTGTGNKLSNCWVRAVARFGSAKLPRYAFYDTVEASQVENRTRYGNCNGQYGTAEFKSITEYLSSPFCDAPIANRVSAAIADVTGTSLIVVTGSQLTGFNGSVYSGKKVTVWAATTVLLVHSTGFRLKGLRNKTLNSNNCTSFTYYNGVWCEDGWGSSDVQSTATTVQLESKTDTVNISNKYGGRPIWNTTDNKQYIASGSVDNSIWYVCDGSASITPV